MLYSVKKHFVYPLCIFLLLAPAGLLYAESKALDKAIKSEPKTLVIGKVSSNPKKHYPYLKPIADYVAHKMGDLGYVNARVLMAKDNEEMVRFLREGRVDWVTETPFSAMALKKQSGAELLLRKWKKNVAEYHTVFFTRKDSGINSLEDLKGKTIAFQDKGSTSAYFIPAYLLIQNGNSLLEVSNHTEKPDGDHTAYLFAEEEINMSTWVHKGIVDAAAFSNLDWAKGDNTPDFFRKDMTIFFRSKSYPRAIELVRGDLPVKVKRRMEQILLTIHKDPSAEAVLKAYQKTKKFDALTPEILKTLEETETILDIVNKTLH